MRTELFDFALPEDRIALRPASPRDSARLLVVRPGAALEDRTVADLPDLLKAGALTAVPLGLILLQPDLGTALVLVPVAVVGAYLAGIQWKHAAVVVLAGVMMLPIGWHFLKPYQKERVTTFLRPEDDPRKSGYQILQSKIAVGSGGFWGKGLGHGSQNQLGFVPVRYSDFILAALAEETGFAGVFVALLLYTALLLRLIQNAQRAKDRAGMFLVMGVAAILSFHVLVNVAMVIGFMPVTGIPLPLMSYGGSATLFVFLALGLVMNVRLRRFVKRVVNMPGQGSAGRSREALYQFRRRPSSR